MNSMIEKARENWRRLKESEPGERFQDGYRRRQQNSRVRFSVRALLGVVGGILVVVGGLIAIPGPGPGWLITCFGLGLIAGEVRSFARFMDRAEVKLRMLGRWCAGVWTKSHTVAKVSICLAGLLCVAALGYAAYYLFFGALLV